MALERSLTVAATTAVLAVGAQAQSNHGATRVCAGGDVTLGNNLDTAWARSAELILGRRFGISAAPESLVAPLRPLFADADVVLVNVESAIGTGPAQSKCGPRSRNCYAFRAPPGAAAALRSIGSPTAVVAGNVANNHSRDAGDPGFESTVALLSLAGVRVTGHDTLATLVVTSRGDSLAVLGFHTAESAPDARDIAAVRRHVARAAASYRAVIVTVHIGAEGMDAQRTRDTTELFLASRIDRGNPVAFADAAFSAGAKLIVAHGPHVLRGAEWRPAGLVLYSLGNLLTYGPFRNDEPINRGAVACADLENGRVVNAELRSTVQVTPGIVARDVSNRAWRLVDSLSRLDFGLTGVRVNSAGALRSALSHPIVKPSVLPARPERAVTFRLIDPVSIPRVPAGARP